MEKEKKKNFHSLLNHFCLHVSISLPLLSSEHPTTQPSHHFILLTYITLITALADRLCADLEILSLVLPPTRFWFLSDNRMPVSFPDLPPSFPLCLAPAMRAGKPVFSCLHELTERHSQTCHLHPVKTATALLRACENIMLVGKTFLGVGLQRAGVLTFRSLLWSLADSGSLNHPVPLLPARAHLYGSEESTHSACSAPWSCRCVPTWSQQHTSPSEEGDASLSHPSWYKLHEDRDEDITMVSTPLQTLREGEKGCRGRRERENPHPHHLLFLLILCYGKCKQKLQRRHWGVGKAAILGV